MMMHLRFLMLSTVILLGFPVRGYSESISVEYQVKAVCLFNFAKYIKWPETAFKSEDQPIKVCILGKSPFGGVFSSDQAPKEAQGRILTVTELPVSASKGEVSECQMLYWQEEHEERAKEVLAQLHGAPLISVTDKESDEALISFAIVDGKVRFRIRHKEAQGAGFNISSQLLKLAIVDE